MTMHQDRVIAFPTQPTPIAQTQGALALDLQPRYEPPGELIDLESRSRRSVEAWALRFVQAVVEIVGGDRPATQLVRWMDREVWLNLERRAQLVARAGGFQPGSSRAQSIRPTTRTVHAYFVAPGVAEVAARIAYGEQSRALAIRFELRRRRWVCTALDFA